MAPSMPEQISLLISLPDRRKDRERIEASLGLFVSK